MSNVRYLDGTPATPNPVANTLVLTDKARDTIGQWLHDESTNTDELVRCLMTLVRMGGRGYHESESLIVFETTTLQVGLFRDSKGAVTLHS